LTFKSKIFIPDNKWYNNYTLSTKLLATSFIGIILCGIIIFFTGGKITNLYFNRFFQIFFLLTTAVPLMTLLIIVPFVPEKLNGKFGADIIINENEIIINENRYLFKDIKEFEVELSTFFGMKPLSGRRYGPLYHQGVNNKFSILINNQIVKVLFLIRDENHFEKIQKTIFKIICDEKIKFKYRYLDYISKDLKTTKDYESFILKLKSEKRLLVK